MLCPEAGCPRGSVREEGENSKQWRTEVTRSVLYDCPGGASRMDFCWMFVSSQFDDDFPSATSHFLLRTIYSSAYSIFNKLNSLDQTEQCYTSFYMKGD